MDVTDDQEKRNYHATGGTILTAVTAAKTGFVFSVAYFAKP